MDKFEQLKAFTQVVDAGGFAAAARVLGLSRSTVNKLVIALENDLGVQLFHRSTRQVTPTATGQAFYERCLTLLADLEEAERAVTRQQIEPKGKLRVNAPMTFGRLHLAPAIAQFMRQYPDLDIQLTLEDRFIDPLEEGYDVVVRIGTPTDGAALVVRPLSAVRLFLCAAPDYLQQEGIPKSLLDLRDRPCLYYGNLTPRPQWKFLDPEGQEQVITVKSRLYSNNGEVLKEAAIQGLGIAILPEFIIADALQEGQLQTFLCDYRPPDLTLCLLYPASRHLSIKLRLLTDFLGDRFS
jgi:DNA-binding transcriptional LysR family regulator